jgi:IS30 family transposase
MNKPGSKHLSYEERGVIEKLVGCSYSLRQIAKILNRSPNTISKEIVRNTVKGAYLADKARYKAHQRRRMSKWQSYKALDYEGLIKNKLKQHWSPETISGWFRKQGLIISAKAVYKFIHSRCLEQYLWGETPRKQKRISYLADSRNFIENRPVLTGFGHYELDFVVCSQNTFSLLVLVEKQTKLTLVYLLPDKTKETLFTVFANAVSRVKIQTVTTDNDLALGCWRKLEEWFRFRIYFTHPYRSWEKPLVEQTNQLIRRFIPKKTNLRTVSTSMLEKIDQFLNHKPRQCLNYLTAYEAYQALSK